MKKFSLWFMGFGLLLLLTAGIPCQENLEHWVRERAEGLPPLEIRHCGEAEAPCLLFFIAPLQESFHHPPRPLSIHLAAEHRDVVPLGFYPVEGSAEYPRGERIRGGEYLRVFFEPEEWDLLSRAHRTLTLKIRTPEKRVLWQIPLRVPPDLFRMHLSGSIEFLAPQKHVTWYNNKTYPIKWKTSGNLNASNSKVNIMAYYQMQNRYVVKNHPNTGVYQWDLSKGWIKANYYLRIGVVGTGITDDSEVFFIRKGYQNVITSGLRQQFLQLINQYRKANGKGPLTYAPCLNQAAQGHSEWMAQTGKFSHTGKNGSKFWQRCQQAGCSCMAENIHGGSVDAAGCFNSWKKSPAHNATMLNGSHTQLGLGMKDFYWTADFN